MWFDVVRCGAEYGVVLTRPFGCRKYFTKSRHIKCRVNRHTERLWARLGNVRFASTIISCKCVPGENNRFFSRAVCRLDILATLAWVIRLPFFCLLNAMNKNRKIDQSQRINVEMVWVRFCSLFRFYCLFGCSDVCLFVSFFSGYIYINWAGLCVSLLDKCMSVCLCVAFHSTISNIVSFISTCWHSVPIFDVLAVFIANGIISIIVS